MVDGNAVYSVKNLTLNTQAQFKGSELIDGLPTNLTDSRKHFIEVKRITPTAETTSE